MGVQIRSQRTYNIDGAQIGLQNPVYFSPVNPGIHDTGPIGQEWINTTNNTLFCYFGNDSSGQAVWTQIGQQAGQLFTITGNDSIAVGPGLGNINIIGNNSTGINVTGNAGTHTLTITNSNRTDTSVQTVGATTQTLVSQTLGSAQAITLTANIVAARSDYSASLSAFVQAGYTFDGTNLTPLPNNNISTYWTDGLAMTIVPSLVPDVSAVTPTILLRVTGEALHTWNWVCSFEYVFVNV